MTRTTAPARRSESLAWLVTGPLAAIAVALGIPASVSHRPVFAAWPVALLFLALFLAAEATTLIVEARRHGLTITVTDIPLVLGLFYLPPLTLIVVRVLAVAVVQYRRGSTPPKFAFNVANIAAASAAATLVVRTFGVPDRTSAAMWLVLFGGVAADAAMGAIAVVGVISLMQGGMTAHRVVRTAIPGLIVSAINGAVGLLALIAVQHNAWSVLLLAGLALVLVVVYRSYAQFLRQHKSLTEMYELTRVVAAATSDDVTLADVLLRRVREMLQAESATMWLPAQGRYPETLLTARADDRGLIDLPSTPQELRARVVRDGVAVAAGARLGGSPDEVALLREQGTKDVIAVPLRSGRAVIGCLEVAGRMGGDTAHFRPDDVRLLETVAAHASVAVENSRLVDRLRFDAYHDGLTKLPNRRRMLDALEQAVAVRAPDEVVAVIQFDVSGLRDVNESLGHEAGNTLLAEVASRLRAAAPPAALVARVGSDEFVVTLRSSGVDEVLALAEKLRDSVRSPMEIGSLALGVDTTVGVAVHPEHGAEPTTLLQRVDTATRAARATSTGVQLFAPGLESRSVRRLGLAGDLRRALDGGDIEVHFQPKVSLPDRALVGVECLARWEHPVHGPVAPEDFVAVAEHTGQLGRLTEAVLVEGLRQCRRWAGDGRPLGVAVNLSSRTLADPGFASRVAALLDTHEVDPRRLTLEIAEAGVLGESDRALPALRQLHDLGVRLSVDDFGSGYSSLSHLRRLPVDEVKIDRSFVQGMATDPDDLAIVRAVTDLARHFGLTVVAEGVESELTLTLLEEIGCDIGQGFLFSRPLSDERLEAWFAAQTEPESSDVGEVRRLRAVT